MTASLDTVINLETYPLQELDFQSRCRKTLEADGALVMPGFLRAEAIKSIAREGHDNRQHAYFCTDNHNVFLTPPDPDFPSEHIRNREVISSKGCIPDDIIPRNSSLRTLYDSDIFKAFLSAVLDEPQLYEYADPLSSINLHYADEGQELGWHFDNSSFAITLLIEEPEAGGQFEYVKGLRDSAKGQTDFERLEQVLEGNLDPDRLSISAGTLVLFRGRDALHRVAPVTGDRTRMLVVLAYNSEPGIALSESARMTFFGRLG
ncbi:MAG: 2OG-Fe(II) oxygenase [Proteobacteria bacterium]|nr:2OG-Fe(II) oxygenase [Pseudomonadota bacterium]